MSVFLELAKGRRKTRRDTLDSLQHSVKHGPTNAKRMALIVDMKYMPQDQ